MWRPLRGQAVDLDHTGSVRLIWDQQSEKGDVTRHIKLYLLSATEKHMTHVESEWFTSVLSSVVH